jgi:hypothetical protein
MNKGYFEKLQAKNMSSNFQPLLGGYIDRTLVYKCIIYKTYTKIQWYNLVIIFL